MTTFRHAARKPRIDTVIIPDQAHPLANRHQQQREVRMRKIALWASDPQFRPHNKIPLTSGVTVRPLTYARATILRDVYGLTCAELVETAVAAYCKMMFKKHPIEHDDPNVVAWLNDGDEQF